jgi:glycosyltransferase involved in cell wall biosynthesis
VPMSALPVQSIDAAGEPVRLSVIMPVLNEGRTIRLALNRLLHTDFPCSVEVIVVDDGSTDSTWQVLQAFDDERVIIRQHPVNRGKGAAVLTGIESASGTHALVFDADLEYDPNDIPRLLQPIIAGKASTVYGTRLFGRDTVYQSFWFALGNRATTLAANMLYDSAISDLHTCLKLLPLQLLRSMDLDEQGFGLDTQITARMLLSGVRPYEVPISYNSRTHDEGKKIGWRHGVESLAILRRERAHARRRPAWVQKSKDVARFHRITDMERLIAAEEARIATRTAAHHRPILPAQGPDALTAEQPILIDLQAINA